MPDPHSFMPVMYPISVRFDPAADPKFTFAGMDPDNKLTVTSGMATIVLTLVPATGQKLTFTESPITWYGEPMPPCMSVQRNSDLQVTIVNYNTNMDPGVTIPYEFEVSVWCDGIGYMSQDPTILNAEVPPGPMDDDCKDERAGQGHGVKRGAALRAAF
jgi:hypothetical protein